MCGKASQPSYYSCFLIETEIVFINGGCAEENNLLHSDKFQQT